MQTAPTSWVQILITVVGLLGGAGGIAAVATVAVQRRKLKADTADVLTDTALQLVEPLKARVRELEGEVQTTRRSAVAANSEVERLRDSVRDLATVVRRWRAEILAPDATLEHLREMVRTVPAAPPPANGRTYPG